MSFELPQVVVDGDGVHAGRDRLGRDDGKLLAVRAVFEECVNHFARYGAWAGSRQLYQLLRVRHERIKCPELAAAITEQDHQVIGLTPLDFLK